MKVLLFCNIVPLTRGGFANLLVKLAGEFKSVGDELVIVFGGVPLQRLTDDLTQCGARWYWLEGWSKPDGGDCPWRLLFSGIQHLAQERPDVAVVHFGDELPCAALVVLGRLLGCRARWVWQQDQQMSDPVGVTRYLSRMRLLGTVCDHFVAMYEGGKRSLVLRGIRGESIAVIHNSTSDFTRQREPGWLREELGLPTAAVLLVTVSALIARKRIDFQLRALSELNGQGYDVVLLVVGEGALKEAMTRVAEELGVASRVRFLGRRDDVPGLLRECDIYLHSSTEEAAPYAIAEAMCAALPAVVTQAGAVAEQIEHGKSGFVLERNDLDGFASHLRDLVADKACRLTMGAAARERWQKSWQVDRAAKQYHSLYRSLCDRRGDA